MRQSGHRYSDNALASEIPIPTQLQWNQSRNLSGTAIISPNPPPYTSRAWWELSTLDDTLHVPRESSQLSSRTKWQAEQNGNVPWGNGADKSTPFYHHHGSS